MSLDQETLIRELDQLKNEIAIFYKGKVRKLEITDIMVMEIKGVNHIVLFVGSEIFG